MIQDQLFGEGSVFAAQQRARGGTSDIGFGQLTGTAAGDYDGDLNAVGIW